MALFLSFSQIPSIRHSRAGGNLGLSAWEFVGEKFPKFHILDSRLRGNDAAGVDWFKPRQNREPSETLNLPIQPMRCL